LILQPLYHCMGFGRFKKHYEDWLILQPLYGLEFKTVVVFLPYIDIYILKKKKGLLPLKNHHKKTRDHSWSSQHIFVNMKHVLNLVQVNSHLFFEVFLRSPEKSIML
jgi:hypothetical protein